MKPNLSGDPEWGMKTKLGLAPAAALLPHKSDPIKTDVIQFPAFYRCDNAFAQIDNDGWHAEMQRTPFNCIAVNLDIDWHGLKLAHETCKKHKMELFVGDNHKIDHKWIKRAPAEAFISGCNTSFNSLEGGRPTDGIQDFQEVLYNEGCYLGGHVHIDVPLAIRDKIMDIVRAMLPFAILPMSIATYSPGQCMRYKRCGVGIFRAPKYGIEFKDFGGATMMSPVHRAACYGLSRQMINAFYLDYRFKSGDPGYGYCAKIMPVIDEMLKLAPPEEVAQCLIGGDLDNMWHIFTRLAPVFENISKVLYDEGSPWNTTIGAAAFSDYRLTVMERFIKFMKMDERKDVVDEWGLNKEFGYEEDKMRPHRFGLDTGLLRLMEEKRIR